MCLYVSLCVCVSPFIFPPYLRVNTGTSPLVDEGLILWFSSSLYIYIGPWYVKGEREGRVRRGECGDAEVRR